MRDGNKKMKCGKLYGIGIGPGDPKLLTLRAKEILEEVDSIFVPKSYEDKASLARSIVERVTSSPKNFIELTFPMTKDKKRLEKYWRRSAGRVARELKKGRKVAFVTIGDPLIYSTYIYLLKTLRQNFPQIIPETVPGVSAFQAASARVGLSLVEGDERMAILPVNEGLEGLKEAFAEFDTVVLMKVGSKLNKVKRLLEETGLLKGSLLASHLGCPNERVVRDLSSMKGRRLGYLSVIIVRAARMRNLQGSPRVYFVGAGPGAPGLLTLKAKEVIARADVIIYAGSLIDRDILKFCRRDATLYDSAGMTREEIFAAIRSAVRGGKMVARLHSGDVSIYSAIQEQIDWCDQQGIDCEVIPGISSYQAASAALKQELTLPEVSQTIILSRISGRTEVPAKEDLERLSKIKATLVLFLSVGEIERVVEKLRAGYDLNTPVAVLEKVSQKGERRLTGTLRDIARKVKGARIKRQALIIVGDVLNRRYRPSKLYDRNFEHTFRKKG